MTATRAQDHDCFAIGAPGLERIMAGELAALGLRPDAIEPGGVAFRAGREGLYTANLHLRTASRVVVRVASFPARAFHELERRARRVEWERWAAAGALPRFRVTCRKSRLYHSDAVAQRLAEALARRVGGGDIGAAGRAAAVARATADEDDEDDGETDGEGSGEGGAGPLFIVRVARDVVTISADSSGQLLHRRGYRQALARAPLRETLAAGLLLAAGYDGSVPLLDPLCGSGTIPIEGALIARRIPPGLAGREDGEWAADGVRGARDFAFVHWPDFDAGAWRRVVERAVEQMRPHAPMPIHGSDRDEGAIAAATANAERAGVAGDVVFARRALSAIEPPAGAPGLIAANPPYGVRVGDPGALRDLFARFGQVARARFPGWTVALLSAEERLDAQLRLPLDELLRTTNGGIFVRVVRARIPALPE
ncbi:MAG TPA: THUMP domain-containing protein [Gemmatimonadaceae bacterium]